MRKAGKSGTPKFEVLKAKTGKFQWQLRGPDGNVVELKVGRIRLPKTTVAQRKAAHNATQHALGLAADKLKA